MRRDLHETQVTARDRQRRRQIFRRDVPTSILRYHPMTKTLLQFHIKFTVITSNMYNLSGVLSPATIQPTRRQFSGIDIATTHPTRRLFAGFAIATTRPTRRPFARIDAATTRPTGHLPGLMLPLPVRHAGHLPGLMLPLPVRQAICRD